MIQQTDSSVVHAIENVPQGDISVAPRTVLTPRMVLSWLPHDATPAQQDSAIQAHFKPSEIRWSQRPDTLHLPGHDKGHNPLDERLPQYYREGFFSNDSLFHPELPGGRIGVAGDPVPYNMRADSIITILLLACFMLAVVSFASAKSFVIRQAKSFVFWPYEGTSDINETSGDLRFQAFLVFFTSLQLALMGYLYTTDTYGDSLMLSSQYYLIAIYMAFVLAYFLLKLTVYSIVNIVFFGGKKNAQWVKSFLFITSLEGVLLFPILLLKAYFDLALQNMVVYFIVVLVIVKFLMFYKSYVIFFRHLVVRLQIILYFCTLEIVPLLTLWAALEITANSLKIIF